MGEDWRGGGGGGLFFLLLPLSLFATGARFPSEGALARLLLPRKRARSSVSLARCALEMGLVV